MQTVQIPVLSLLSFLSLPLTSRVEPLHLYIVITQKKVTFYFIFLHIKRHSKCGINLKIYTSIHKKRHLHQSNRYRRLLLIIYYDIVVKRYFYYLFLTLASYFLLRTNYKFISINPYRYHITRMNLITENLLCKKCLDILL